MARSQAAEAGIGAPQWRRLCRDGVLVPVFPGVARLAGASDTPMATIKAATLAVGRGARASHESAVAVWGGPSPGTDPVHLSVVGGGPTTMAGIVVHRPSDHVDLDAIVRNGIPTTRPLRTLCDLGATHPDLVADALDWFVGRGIVTAAAVAASLDRHRRRGRAGTAALAEALTNMQRTSKPADSLLEAAMARIFATHRLPPFEFHARVAGYEVDFLVVGTPIVLETDGWATHGLDRDQFERDRVKGAALAEAGYVVQRFTWTQVRRQPAWVAERIRALVQRWAPELLTG